MKRINKRKYHYIYRISRFDGMYYVGIHSTDNLDDNYYGSGKYIKRSILKHGKEKHTKMILEMFETRELLIEKEKELVNQALIDDPNCMNIKPGGLGGFGQVNRAQRAKTIEDRYGKDYYKKIASSARSENHKEKLRQASFANGSGKCNTGLKRAKIECPHCHKTGATNVMVRFHFDNCKSL
jgi:hypothetical protein